MPIGDPNQESEKESTCLFISRDYAPSVWPTAIRAGCLRDEVAKTIPVAVICKGNESNQNSDTKVFYVKDYLPKTLLKFLTRFKFEKLLNYFIWPDDGIFWIIPAYFKALEVIRTSKVSCVVIFMMPYSAGLLGLMLKKKTGLPIVFNFDDSITCTDMHPTFPSRLHFRLACFLEDWYLKVADCIIFVSQRTMDRVLSRNPESVHKKCQVIRYGIDTSILESVQKPHPKKCEVFNIVYIGGMNGWFSFETSGHILKKLYRSWMDFGVFQQIKLDYQSSSPVFLARAIKELEKKHPTWKNKIKLTIYGYNPGAVAVNRVLQDNGIAEIVTVCDAISHDQAIQVACDSDLLFLTLPDRPDGSAGGRISAKTYEYMATDRPILATIPNGENRDFLSDKPGVFLVYPRDEHGMAKVLELLVSEKNKKKSIVFDREDFLVTLDYKIRGKELIEVIQRISNS